MNNYTEHQVASELAMLVEDAVQDRADHGFEPEDVISDWTDTEPGGREFIVRTATGQVFIVSVREAAEVPVAGYNVTEADTCATLARDIINNNI